MMTQTEQRVMDLYDKGLRSNQIAAITGIEPAKVRRIMGLYADGDNGFADGIVAGTRDLRIAIERAHPATKMQVLP